MGYIKVFCLQLMPTNCSAAKQLPQFCKHSKSADLLRKSLLSHVWRVPSSKALSCKHERLFDLWTLVASFYHGIEKEDSENEKIFDDRHTWTKGRGNVTISGNVGSCVGRILATCS